MYTCPLLIDPCRSFNQYSSCPTAKTTEVILWPIYPCQGPAPGNVTGALFPKDLDLVWLCEVYKPLKSSENVLTFSAPGVVSEIKVRIRGDASVLTWTSNWDLLFS